MTSLVKYNMLGNGGLGLDEKRTVNDWKSEMKVILESKTTEFHLIGYPRATPEEIWSCLVKKVWKGNPEKRLFEIVQDIFHLSTTTYMSYITVNAYQADEDLASSIAALTGSNL